MIYATGFVVLGRYAFEGNFGIALVAIALIVLGGVIIVSGSIILIRFISEYPILDR